MNKEEKNKINRREFVKNTSLTEGALSATILPSFGSTKPKDVDASRSHTSQRSLGSLKVSAIGFGCMNLAGIYKPATSQSEAVKVLRAAYDNGVTFYDTAQSYGHGLSEQQVGQAVKPFRDKVVIATKFGWEIDFDSKAVKGFNSRPDYIKRATDLSRNSTGVWPVLLLNNLLKY